MDLVRSFWHRGIVTEAEKAFTEQVIKDGLPYITECAIKTIQEGMTYRYSYEE